MAYLAWECAWVTLHQYERSEQGRPSLSATCIIVKGIFKQAGVVDESKSTLPSARSDHSCHCERRIGP